MTKFFRTMLQKITAIVLSACLLSESLSPAAPVDAAKTTPTEQTTEAKTIATNVTESQPEVVTELPKERTLNSNTYLLSDGEKELVTYMDDIRYKDASGKLVDYEPELVRIGKKDRKVLENIDIYKKDKRRLQKEEKARKLRNQRKNRGKNKSKK